MKKVTTNITYKVPNWNYCNHTTGIVSTHASKEKCRFCVKDKKGYRCALYNMPLLTEESQLVVKTHTCIKTTAGINSTVTDEADIVQVDPKLIMKTTLDMYKKYYKSLISQGYPEALADKVASEYVLGGK